MGKFIAVIAFVTGIALFQSLPHDSAFHIQGLIAGLLCIGSCGTFLMLMTETEIEREDREQRKQEMLEMSRLRKSPRSLNVRQHGPNAAASGTWQVQTRYLQ